VDESDCANTGGGVATGAVLAQAAFHPAQQHAQHCPLQGGVALQKVAQALGDGEHPLPHRQSGENMVLFSSVELVKTAANPMQERVNG